LLPLAICSSAHKYTVKQLPLFGMSVRPRLRLIVYDIQIIRCGLEATGLPTRNNQAVT